MKFRLRHADKFVGLFFLIALVFVFTVLIIVGSNQRWFSKDVTYFTQFPTADGLSRNLSVRLSGFEIGKVVSYELNSANTVDVAFVIYESYHARIHPGTVVELKSNPLGLSSGMALYPGVNTSSLLRDGSFIPRINSAEGKRLVDAKLVNMPDTGDPIGAIMESIEPLLLQISTTVELVNNTLSSVDLIAAAFAQAVEGEDARPLGRVVENLAETTATIRDLMSDLETPDGIVRRVLGAEGSIATLLDDDNELYYSLLRSFESLEGALSGVEDLGQGISQTSPQLAVLIAETQATLEETRMVLEGIRNNPLLRGGIQEERETITNEAGYRNADF